MEAAKYLDSRQVQGVQDRAGFCCWPGGGRAAWCAALSPAF